MNEYFDLSSASAVVDNAQATSAELQAVAAAQPSLWQRIAAHPNANPALLSWLGRVGDDSVRQVIGSRAPSAAPDVSVSSPSLTPAAPDAAPRRLPWEPAPTPAPEAPAAPAPVPEPTVPVAATRVEVAAPSVVAPSVPAPAAPAPSWGAPPSAPAPAAPAPSWGAPPSSPVIPVAPAPAAPAPAAPAPSWGSPAVASAPAAPAMGVSAPVAPPYPGQPAPAGYYPGGQMATPMAQAAPKKKGKGGIIALIVALALLLAGGIGGWWAYSNWSIQSMTVSFDGGGSSSLKMNVGDSMTGTVTITPANPLKDSYTYTSSDAGRLSLTQDGAKLTIKALKPGTAVITGTTANKAITTTTNVTILQPATDITGLPDSIVLDEGATQQVTAAIVPDDSTDSIAYAVDDTSVASVDNTGLVTAVKAGSATLTVTAGSITKPVPITVNVPYTWERGDTSEDIGNTPYTATPWIANTTVPKCTGFTLFYSVLSVTPDSYGKYLANQDYAIYTWGPSGGWQKVATFPYGEISTIYDGEITFPARDISKVAILPTNSPNVNLSWSSYGTISDTKTG